MRSANVCSGEISPTPKYIKYIPIIEDSISLLSSEIDIPFPFLDGFR